MATAIAIFATLLAFFAFAQCRTAPHNGGKSTSRMTPERRPKLEMKDIAMRKSIVTVLAALTLSGIAATPASAEEVSVVVPYADLDLTRDAGSATLEARIEAAVDKVCARPALRDLKAMAAWETCKETARLGAMEQLSVLETYESLALTSAF
jgi:UrcA family protein